jgi:hypothetical protein
MTVESATYAPTSNIVFVARAVTHFASSRPFALPLILEQCAARTDGFAPSGSDGLYSFTLDAVENFLLANSLSNVVLRGEQAQIAPNVVTLATAAGDESVVLILEKTEFSPLKIPELSKTVENLDPEGSNIPPKHTRIAFSFQRISHESRTGNQVLPSGQHVATDDGPIEDENEEAGSSPS